MPKYPRNGMNRRELDRVFRELGGEKRHVRRTGEAVYRHWSCPRSVRVNDRRKDAPRELVNLVRTAYVAVQQMAGEP